MSAQSKALKYFGYSKNFSFVGRGRTVIVAGSHDRDTVDPSDSSQMKHIDGVAPVLEYDQPTEFEYTYGQGGGGEFRLPIARLSGIVPADIYGKKKAPPLGAINKTDYFGYMVAVNSNSGALRQWVSDMDPLTLKDNRFKEIDMAKLSFSKLYAGNKSYPSEPVGLFCLSSSQTGRSLGIRTEPSGDTYKLDQKIKLSLEYCPGSDSVKSQGHIVNMTSIDQYLCSVPRMFKRLYQAVDDIKNSDKASPATRRLATEWDKFSFYGSGLIVEMPNKIDDYQFGDHERWFEKEHSVMSQTHTSSVRDDGTEINKNHWKVPIYSLAHYYDEIMAENPVSLGLECKIKGFAKHVFEKSDTFNTFTDDEKNIVQSDIKGELDHLVDVLNLSRDSEYPHVEAAKCHPDFLHSQYTTKTNIDDTLADVSAIIGTVDDEGNSINHTIKFMRYKDIKYILENYTNVKVLVTQSPGIASNSIASGIKCVGIAFHVADFVGAPIKSCMPKYTIGSAIASSVPEPISNPKDELTCPQTHGEPDVYDSDFDDY